ncbi:hypothetical protein SPRG_21873 [Saprolegnia parasitica CBS 223.65]|uniref:Uncharacterized protein n=1 Tax=Saprolegnia parasitica (strain CBS 223.65) TaxID=695850 RepID=A0A067BKI3_SAPPC|nr:hypothetical protein SPRG_21873 [Saprolegnia parasitica CBS 223.65]KDO17205.1 hypothetical protein SPRG_21873 [Saprolegnia parasitica CBS 223.65]|eukprot:XP_012212085.1 hypothetical protein SPRG_21873 [Saprolegnia parasitica CBS 223.65]
MKTSTRQGGHLIWVMRRRLQRGDLLLPGSSNGVSASRASDRGRHAGIFGSEGDISSSVGLSPLRSSPSCSDNMAALDAVVVAGSSERKRSLRGRTSSHLRRAIVEAAY